MVTNAGTGGHDTHLDDMDAETWDDMINASIRAARFCAAARRRARCAGPAHTDGS